MNQILQKLSVLTVSLSHLNRDSKQKEAVANFATASFCKVFGCIYINEKVES